MSTSVSNSLKVINNDQVETERGKAWEARQKLRAEAKKLYYDEGEGLRAEGNKQ